MTRVEAIPLNTIENSNLKKLEIKSEEFVDIIGKRSTDFDWNKLHAERLKNVPKDVQEKYQEDKEIVDAIRSKYEADQRCYVSKEKFLSSLEYSFSEEKMLQCMSLSERPLYLKYKKVIENLETQYPELDAGVYFAEILAEKPAEKNEVQLPCLDDPAVEIPHALDKPVDDPVAEIPHALDKPVDDPAAEIPNTQDKPVAKSVKCLKSAAFGPILGDLINDSDEKNKDDNLLKTIIKAPLGFLARLFS